MENLRSFTVTFLGQTSTEPHRIKIVDNLNRTTIKVPVSHIELNSRDNVARAAWYLKEKFGIICKYQTEIYGKSHMILTENFTIKIKQLK